MTPLALEHEHRPDGLADFRVKTTLWIALSGVFFLAPFGLNNFARGQLLLGGGAIVIVLVLAAMAHVSRQGRQSRLSLLLFPPVLAFLALSIQEQGVIGVMWTYPAIVMFYFIYQEKWAWVANTVIICTTVPVAANLLESAVALRAVVTLTVVSVFSIMAIRVLGAQQQRLEQMAVTDSLTGLLNRSLLIPTLNQAIARKHRTGESSVLLTVDIDHFKEINDTFGHVAGDQVLVGVAELLRNRLRGSDVLFRTGGEEFSIVLPDTGSEPGHHVAQLLRSAVAGENLLEAQAVTVSVGAAHLLPEDTAETWFARADDCLYRAKHGGRNRVHADAPLLPPAQEATSDTAVASERNRSPFLRQVAGLRALPSR